MLLLSGIGALLALVISLTALAPRADAIEAPSPSVVPWLPDEPSPSDSPPPSDTADSRRPGHFIVVFKDSVDRPGRLAETQTEQRGGELGFVYASALKGYSAELSKGAVEKLREDPRVKFVTPDHRMETSAQWTPSGVRRTFGPSNPELDIDQTDDVRINVDVAVIDTGVDFEHSDLNVVERTDCFSESESPVCVDGTGIDGHGHGTYVAGIVAALDNGVGVVGMAPGARLWAVKALDDGGIGYESTILAAVNWVTAHASQIEVANMSLGCLCKAPALDAGIKASVEAGVVYAVAAGNEATDASEASPASNPDVITVSALADHDGAPGGLADPSCRQDPDDTLASFSNYGEDVEIAAPGVCIKSTWPGNTYEEKSGTSVASPHVAGAAALLAAKANPGNRADVEAIRARLIKDGNSEWTDTSGDGVKEPLLDVGTIATETPSIASESKATLRGRVKPAGLSTTYRFEYGTSTSYGTSVPLTGKSIGSGIDYVAVSEVVEGLKKNTTYHYRITATNSKGTLYGADQVFATTAPAVQTGAASTTGHKATIKATINPAGGSTRYYFEYGDTTSYGYKAPISPGEVAIGASPVEVDESLQELSGGTTFHYRIVATNIAGTSVGNDKEFTTEASPWKAQLIGGSAPDVLQTSVSCVSANACITVGSYWEAEAGIELAWAKRWNGKEWSVMPTPIPAGVGDPSGFSWARLTDVSCTSANACIAVGVYVTENSWTKPLLMSWNGAEWALMSPPAMAPNKNVMLLGVSCSAATACTAVGRNAGSSNPLALRWNGSTWTVQSVSFSTPHDSSEFAEVSCFSATYCVAVGAYREPYPHESCNSNVIMRWNGSKWDTQLTAPNPEGEDENSLFGVSCVSASACVAVGSASTKKSKVATGFVWRWNGSEWSADSVEMPGVSSRLLDVFCEAATACTAVGFVDIEGVGVRPLMTRWNGSAWALEELDSLMVPQGTSYSASLGAVSCKGETFCTGAGGFYNDVTHVELPLIQRSRYAAPAATTAAASNLAPRQVNLNGSVDPGIVAADHHFEYGLTTSYGSRVPVIDKTVAAGAGKVSVSETISGLVPNTAYHFRLVASNVDGTSHGSDFTVTTSDATPLYQSSFGSSGSGNGQLASPSGVAVDAAGNTWVSEAGNHRIQKFNANGEYVLKFGTNGTGNGQFNTPFDLAIDAAGNIWVADSFNSRIQKFNDKGEYLSKFGSLGTGVGQLAGPSGIAVDAKGDIWIADTLNGRVQKFNSSGGFIKVVAPKGSGAGQVLSPIGIDVGPTGNVWVADAGGNRIVEFNEAGEYIRQVGSTGTGNGQFKAPRGLEVDNKGYVWVVDDENSRVQQFTETGEYVAKFGSAGSGTGQFEFSGQSGIASDAKGNLWIGDTANNRVQRWYVSF